MKNEVAVECSLVSDSSHPWLPLVERTYTESFPEEERRAFPLLLDLLADSPYFRLYLLTVKGQYVGFITVWQFERFTYVEHFAIDPVARSGGIGAAAMRQQLEQVQQPVVLEVEPPEDDLTRRRVGFYERLGFVLDEHPYQQPPYREGDPWLDLRLMYFGIMDFAPLYEEVREQIYKQVYKVK